MSTIPNVTSGTTIDPSARAAIVAALADGPGLDAPAEAPWDRFARTFAGTLCDASGRLTLVAAVGAAISAAKCEVPLSSAESQEAWARVCALASAREIARHRSQELEPAARTRLLDAAWTIVAECDQALAFPAESPSPATLVGRMIAAARSSASVARVRARGVVSRESHAHCVSDEIDAMLPRVLDRDSAARGATRYALSRADETLRRRNVPPPGTHGERADRARASLIESAAGLITAVPRDERVTPQATWAHLWLARRACRIVLIAGEGASDLATVVGSHTGISPGPTTTHAAEDTVKEPESTLLKTLETDATDAAWRTAGTQFVKLAREPLVAMLSRHLAPDDASFRARVATFLETDIGAALLASMLSLGLGALPNAAGDVPQRLARELRVRAIAEAGNVVADVLMEPLRQVMSTYLRDASPALRRVDPSALTESASEAFASVSAPATSSERSAS